MLSLEASGLATTLATNLGAACVMVAILCATGARVRRLLRTAVPPRLALSVDFTFGSGLVGFVVVVLGIVHLLTVSTLVAVLLAAAVAGRWRRNGWHPGALVAPAVGALPLLPVALAPPFFYDALIYHLGLPWQALLEHGWLAHPETVYSSAPPLFQALAVVPLSLGLERTPALLHLAAFVVAGSAVDAVARRLGARAWAARLAAFCVPLAPLYVLVPGLPAAEGFGTVAVASATGLLLARPQLRGQAVAVGALLGIGAAARVQVLPIACSIGLAALGLWRRPRALAWLAFGGMVGSAAWWLKNLVLLGTPWLPIGFAGAGADAMWRDAVSLMGGIRGVSDLVRPLVSDLGPHVAVLGPLALAGTLLLWRRRGRSEVLLALILIASLAAWIVTAAITRYLAPWYALLLMVAAASSSFRLGRWAAGLALGCAAVLSVAVTSVHVRRIGGLRLLFDQRQDLQEALVVNDPFPAFDGAAALPRDALVAFVGEPRIFGFPRRCLAPSYYDASPLRPIFESATSVAGVRSQLRALGVSHVLVNWGELRRLAAGYPVLPFATPGGGELFHAFLAACGPAVISVGGVEIFAIGNVPGGERQ